ncbi:MAG TPA: hypothetical protein VH637_24195 [Streptosporangiaceae bacterium]|jgi:hypothetical protein
MLTEDQLAEQLGAQLRRETSSIEPRPDLLASLRRRRARRSLAARAGMVAVPAAAAAAAVAMVVSAGGGSAAVTGKSAVLTAATVQRMASHSRLALARSGRAKISYRLAYNGDWQGSGTDSISFAGKNWNDVISQTSPVGNGRSLRAKPTINRIVNGQFYLYTQGADGKERWYREISQAGPPSVRIPDPRTLFGLLDPSASFKVTGHKVAGGVRLTGLTATKQPQLRALTWLPGVQPGGHVAFLTVWVDRQGVVHQISLRTAQNVTVNPVYFKMSAGGRVEVVVPNRTYLKEARTLARKLRATQHATAGIDSSLSATVHHYFEVSTVSVTFSAFGEPQVITVPKHATPQHGRG